MWPLRILHRLRQGLDQDQPLNQISYRKILGSDFAVFSIYDVNLEQINVHRWCQNRDRVADAIIELKTLK